VVGAGTIADWHVRALKIAGLQVAAVGTRPGSQRLAKFAARHAIPAVFEDWRDMLAHPEWDGLVIAVSTEGTVDVLSAATPIGVPILVEKPTAWTSAVLQPLVESAAQQLIVGYNRRFYRPVQEARAEAQRRSPLLAQLTLPEAVKPQGEADPERRYLLPFLENSCHGFDLARFVLGPLHVERVDRRVDSDDRLVSLGAVLSSDRGDLVQLVANWDAPANFGLSLNGADWRFDLCPFELATIYRGMDVFDPTDEVPIRRYVPRVAGRIPVDEIDTKEKPGFVRQAEALKDMMAGKDPPEFAASLPDAVAALRLCEELLGPYVPTYPR